MVTKFGIWYIDWSVPGHMGRRQSQTAGLDVLSTELLISNESSAWKYTN